MAIDLPLNGTLELLGMTFVWSGIKLCYWKELPWLVVLLPVMFPVIFIAGVFILGWALEFFK